MPVVLAMSSQQSHDPRIQTFLHWVEQNCVNGLRDIENDPDSPFVPSGMVREYFKNRARVQDLLDALFGESAWFDIINIETIQKGYPRTFAIAVCSGLGQHIHTFIQHRLDDGRLPLLVEPKTFPKGTEAGNDLFASFYRRQWAFCSPRFERQMDRIFEPDYILPIIKREIITEGVSGRVYKVWLHERHNFLCVTMPDSVEPAVSEMHPHPDRLDTLCSHDWMANYLPRRRNLPTPSS